MRTIIETFADGIMRDLTIKQSAIRFLLGMEYTFAVDADSNCDVYVNRQYEDTLFDYADMLDFSAEIIAKVEAQRIIRELKECGESQLTHCGKLYEFEFEDASGTCECYVGKQLFFSTRDPFEFTESITEILRGE